MDFENSKTMKIATVLGARPQFIKAAAVSRAIREAGGEEFVLHTGQHYDDAMSEIFFRELSVPKPFVNLEVGSGKHGEQTGKMMVALEPVIESLRPEAVLVYGDTNSTLAGALVAAKLHIPVAHVEAGLRSFNRRMPEEVNRVVTDHLATWLFCPTHLSVSNLEAEGIRDGVEHVGDVMYDSALAFGDLVRRQPSLCERTEDLAGGDYVLATIHRAENTDDAERLRAIAQGLSMLARSCRVVFPMHPRTRSFMDSYSLWDELGGVEVWEPLGFLDMIAAESSASVIVTDSGGVQKEACFHQTPCVTVRPETEWIETVTSGWNTLVNADAEEIVRAVELAKPGTAILEYGVGDASSKIVKSLFS